MRLYALLTVGSCAALLVGCSKDPKRAGTPKLPVDAQLLAAMAHPPTGSPVNGPNGKAGAAPAASRSGGGGRVNRISMMRGGATVDTWYPSGSGGGLVRVQSSSNSEVWLSATEPQANGMPSTNSVFTDTKPVVDTGAVSTPVFNNRGVNIGQSAIGLGNLLDVGGAWGGGSTGYTGYSQVFAQSFGLGFEGYHQGFNQADPWPSAPKDGHFGPPPSWNPPDPYPKGDAPPSGGNPPKDGGNPPGPPNEKDDFVPDFNRDQHGPPPPVTATPEPGSIVLLATGLLVLVPFVRRRRRA